MKKFTDVVDFVGGKPVLFEGTKPYVSTGALKNTTISREDIELVEFINRPSRADLEVKKGDILFAKMAFTDKRILIDNDTSNYIYSTGFFAVRAKPNIITTECLYYLLNSKTFKDQKDANSTGATQKAITNSGLKKIYLRIPNYNNQKEIAEILSNIEKIISFKERQLKEYDQLIKSRFVEMFGDPIKNEKKWNVNTLNVVCDVRDGTHDSPKYVDEGYPFITSKNITNNGIDFSTAQFINENDYLKINQRSRVDNGDILMPMIGTVGGAIIVKKDRDFAIKNVALIKFNTKKVLNEFIKHILNSDAMNFHFDDLKKGGTQKFIGLKTIRNLRIITPSIELQSDFAKFVQQVDKLKFKLQKSVDEAQLLFDSLLQKYFG